MNTKQKGFTLIELLVVIVILGILATLSFGSFRKYFGSANDATRLAVIKSLALDVRATYVAADGDMYTGLTEEILARMFVDNDLEFRPRNNICMIVGVGGGDDAAKGSDNQFVVASWGESQSTADTTQSGVIAEGTLNAKNKLIEISQTGSVNEEDFRCDGTGQLSGMESSDGLGSSDTQYFLVGFNEDNNETTINGTGVTTLANQ